ncbi:MAG TPA: CPBP family intramembrane glutamic endopeptidase [Gemmatimonadaceae bacterium]
MNRPAAKHPTNPPSYFVSVRVSLYWKRLLLFFAGAALCVLLYLFLLNFPGLGTGSASAGIVPVLALAASTWLLTLRFLRLDGVSLSQLGLGAGDHRLARLGIGFVAGSVLTLVWLAIVILTTGATWHLNPKFRAIALIGWCVFAFFNNVGEELVYRGYAFVRLADRFGPYVAALSTTSLFALLHLQAGIPWLSVLAGVFSSGLIFAAIFARWLSVPLALGFHVATNIVQDASGLRTSAASLFALTFPQTAPNAGALTLGSIALINVILAAVILETSGKRGAQAKGPAKTS